MLSESCPLSIELSIISAFFVTNQIRSRAFKLFGVQISIGACQCSGSYANVAYGICKMQNVADCDLMKQHVDNLYSVLPLIVKMHHSFIRTYWNGLLRLYGQ